MKVILLKDVPKVGHKFEVKEVADGFGRNVIMARGLGMIATPVNLTKVGQEITKAEETAKLRQELIKKGVQELNDLELSLTGKANKEGHLFAAIHKTDIVKAIKEQIGVEVNVDWLVLDKPLKTAGEHLVEMKVGDNKATIKVVISSTE
ncbi:MAG: 50S ribosomal protein L9 [Patescibacteria group bacterium]